ncbi:hypothetical protein QWJ34_15435 [Saccharibacillus sp. CPCC 101409]|uniref:hypothetical protein n=1 Tax=Saccharibacillus sp. CPCC 101409 TaxID=3058041 RepID=UPI002671B30D|nr:hypothetical protein [Saccharibacillus sp. CPCC 101409]MDO3411158.1 hypothetical protein [Saccharibacillus sp. CPCC 101409]
MRAKRFFNQAFNQAFNQTFAQNALEPSRRQQAPEPVTVNAASRLRKPPRFRNFRRFPQEGRRIHPPHFPPGFPAYTPGRLPF